MKKRLSVTQVIILLVCCLLPFLDGMFHWHSSNIFEGYNSKTAISMQNVFCVQDIAPGEFVFWLFILAIMASSVFFIAQLFRDSLLQTSNKGTLTLPCVSLALGIILNFSADSHLDSYKAVSGFTRTISVSIGILGWIELVLLAGVIIIECYKHYKCEE